MNLCEIHSTRDFVPTPILQGSWLLMFRGEKVFRHIFLSWLAHEIGMNQLSTIRNLDGTAGRICRASAQSTSKIQRIGSKQIIKISPRLCHRKIWQRTFFPQNIMGYTSDKLWTLLGYCSSLQMAKKSRSGYSLVFFFSVFGFFSLVRRIFIQGGSITIFRLDDLLNSCYILLDIEHLQYILLLNRFQRTKHFRFNFWIAD